MEFLSASAAPLLSALLAALLNGAWVTMLLFGLAWIALYALKSFRQVNAATRYGIWTFTLALIMAAHVIFVFPITGSDASVVPSLDPIGTHIEAGINAPEVTEIPVSTEASVKSEIVPGSAESTGISQIESAAAPATVSNSAARGVNWRVSGVGSWILLGLIGAWLSIVAFKLLKLTLSFASVRRLRNNASPVTSPDDFRLLPKRLSRRMDIRTTEQLSSPVAVGPFQAAILIPAGLRDQLSEDEFQQILLHEAAHLERRDDWTLLFQRIVECFLFFHPAVWWIGSRMQSEREMACDEWVISRTQRPVAYVSSISRLVELRLGVESLTLAPGLAVDRGNLLVRMRRILENGLPTSSNLSSRQMAVAVGLLTLVIALIVFSSSLLNLSLSFDHEHDAPDASLEIGRAAPVASATMVKPVLMVDDIRLFLSLPANLTYTMPGNLTYNMPGNLTYTMPGNLTSNLPGKLASNLPGKLTTGLPAKLRGTLPTVGLGLPSAPRLYFAPPVPLSAASWIKLFGVAKGISSSSDRAQVLLHASSRIPDRGGVYDAYLDAVDSMAASGDRSQCILVLLDRAEKKQMPYLKLIESASAVFSSSERSRVLLAIHREAPESEAIQDALLNAADEVSSSGDRERILRALARRSN